MNRALLPSLLRRSLMAAAVGAAVVACLPGSSQAQRVIRPGGGPVGEGSVGLPYNFGTDNTNTTWRIYQYGQIQQQGNNPLYSQGAMLYINGNQAQTMSRTAKMDGKSGELVLEGMVINGTNVTRRIAFDKENNLLRYIDVLKNPTGQEQRFDLMIQTSLNYGVNTSQMVADPKKATQQVGWAAQTSGNGAVMEMFNGKGSKTPMTLNYQQGNSQINANLQVTIPAGKEVAVMHLHGVFPTQEAAANYMTKVKESDLVKKVPAAIRKLLVNFAGGNAFVGDLELLRGDILDVVELRSGDQLKGTIQEQNYEVTTFYGQVPLPVEKVIAVLNVGNFRPRQLVVTADGQIFGGAIKQETISLQLSSGQVTKIPLSQVNRLGYRKKSGEPEEWTFEKPLVVMRSGERVSVKLPESPLEVTTRFGKLSIKPEQLASIVLQGEDGGLHQFTLTDGSKFNGLLSADVLDMTLDTGVGAGQAVKFPVSSLARCQFTQKLVEPDELMPTIKLANEDLLVGAVTGTLKLDTSFDTIPIAANELRELRRSPNGATDVQAVLFDGSTLSGQLQELDLQAEIAAGLKVKVPLALLEEYVQPQPSPGKEMEQKITDLLKQLADTDWKARDRAHQDLVKLGPPATGVLRRLRDKQDPEAQKRIDSILKELDAQRSKPKPAASGSGSGVTAPPPGLAPQQLQPFRGEVQIEG